MSSLSVFLIPTQQQLEFQVEQYLGAVFLFETSCLRPVKMMQSEHLFATIGFDTAENEPAKVSMKWGIEPQPSLSGRFAQEVPLS